MNDLGKSKSIELMKINHQYDLLVENTSTTNINGNTNYKITLLHNNRGLFSFKSISGATKSDIIRDTNIYLDRYNAKYNTNFARLKSKN